GGLRLMASFCLPGLLLSAVFLAIPLLSARSDDFYFGQADLGSSILTLIYSSLRIGGVIPWNWAHLYDVLLRFAGFCFFPIMLAGIGILWLSTWRTPVMNQPESLFFRLVGGALLCSVLILFAAHLLINLRYPYGRTG